MNVEARLEAIEKKLGIEPPEEVFGLFWDEDGPDSGCTVRAGKLTGRDTSGDPFEVNGESWYGHFLAFTPEELARFRAAGLFKY